MCRLRLGVRARIARNARNASVKNAEKIQERHEIQNILKDAFMNRTEGSAMSLLVDVVREEDEKTQKTCA